MDTRGLILAHYRMEDTLTDAIDVVPAKARSTVYYCRPGGPFSGALVNNGFGFAFGDAWPGFPQDPTGQDRGVALTTRTLGFLSQPFSVAEVFTGAKGKQVDVADTVKGFAEILDGQHDEVPEANFYMKGGIEDIQD